METRRVPACQSPALRAQRLARAGFTLIEVLVAVLVLSFGMLGVVGLQAAAMQANKEARYQSAAVRLGREYAEMMRANNVVARTAGSPYIRSGTADPSAPGTDCRINSCGNDVLAPPPAVPVTAARTLVAQYEVFEWFQRAKQELPGVRVDVCFDTDPYDSDGRPVWACTAPASLSRGQPAFIKIGWTQQTINRAADGSAGSPVIIRATDTNARPLVVVPAQLN